MDSQPSDTLMILYYFHARGGRVYLNMLCEISVVSPSCPTHLQARKVTEGEKLSVFLPTLPDVDESCPLKYETYDLT